MDGHHQPFRGCLSSWVVASSSCLRKGSWEIFLESLACLIASCLCPLYSGNKNRWHRIFSPKYLKYVIKRHNDHLIFSFLYVYFCLEVQRIIFLSSIQSSLLARICLGVSCYALMFWGTQCALSVGGLSTFLTISGKLWVFLQLPYFLLFFFFRDSYYSYFESSLPTFDILPISWILFISSFVLYHIFPPFHRSISPKTSALPSLLLFILVQASFIL